MRKKAEKICTHCFKTFLVDIYQALCPECGCDLVREIDPVEVKSWMFLLLIKEGLRRHRLGRRGNG